MRSEGERDAGGAGLDRLAGVLAEARGGVPPTSVELAEVLWLARHTAPLPPEPTVPPPPSSLPPSSVPGEPAPTPAPPGPPPAAPPPPAPAGERRVPLRLPDRAPPEAAPLTGAADTAPHTRLLAPAPPMLARPLALQRALRPLKRRTPSPVRRELDEEATAHRIARLGARPEWWLPVLRPAAERWLALHLVEDAGPTMPVWRPLVRELHAALAQSGVFRTVELHRADADGGVRPGLHPAADGRTVTLLVSDCMGPQWWEGAAGARWYRTLRYWAEHMPLAVVQPLPERLWRDTALPTTAGLFAAPAPAAPTAALSFAPYSSEPEPGALAVPVLEPAATWLAHWSALVADPGAARLPGAAALLPRRPTATCPDDGRARRDVTRLPAGELVLRFRSTASAEAFRLAGHLAVGEPHLPVMRLVQAAVEPHPRPQHLAEVILSGMLTSTGPGRYAFRPGVRELLLRTLPRTARGRTTELLARVGALIDARAGVTAGEFRALAPRQGGAGEAHRESEPVAMVREASVRQLSGPAAEGEVVAGRYRLVERLGSGGTLWRAVDPRGKGRPVVVQRFTTRGAREAADFLAAARALDDLRGRHVVTVEDYGVDEETGAAYLVTEYVAANSLRSFLAAHDGRLPADVLLDLVPQLALALGSVHAGKVSHGALSSSYVMLSERGPVLSRFSLRPHTAASRRADLAALGRLLRETGRGTSLREHVRSEFQTAVNGLLSGSEPLQRDGLERLTRLSPPDRAPVQFFFLGPLRIYRDGEPLAPVSGRAQAMLWMLLRQPGRRVPDGELAAGLWGDQPPKDTHGTLAAYASRIRRAVGDDVLVREGDGYTVPPDRADVDVLRCEEYLRAATDARREHGLDLVEYALGPWWDGPLDGVPGPAAAADRDRLHRLHRTLRALRAELRLELGRVEEALDDLASLVREAPTDEDVRRLHMRALFRREHAVAAVESYEDFLASGGTPGTDTRRLYQELRAAVEPGERTAPAHTAVLVELADPEHEDTRLALGRAVNRLIDVSGLTALDCELSSRPDGYEVLVRTESAAKRLLTATVRRLADAVAELVPGVPRLVVTFRPARARPERDRDVLRRVLDTHGADAVVGVTHELHTELSPLEHVGLRIDTSPPTFWYTLLYVPVAASDGGPEHPVRGPRPLPAEEVARELAGEPPSPGPHRVVVYVRPDGTATLDGPGGATAPGWHYYDVSLVERSVFVSRSPRTWAAVRVVDPVEAVRHSVGDLPARLAERLDEESGRLPSPLDVEKLERRLLRWKLPGYAVRWLISPSAVPRRSTVRSDLVETLTTAECFLLGFDGTLVDLYPTTRASRAAVRELTSLVTDLQQPGEVVVGVPLLAGMPLREDGTHPVDVLRAVVRHPRLAHPLAERLAALETQALDTARPVDGAYRLIHALKRSGLPVSVVSDADPRVIAAYLRSRSLDEHTGILGRGRPYRLLPDPDVLRRALLPTRTPPRHAVLIGSTHVELAAARDLGVPFVGHAADERARAALVAAGAVLAVPSLADLADVVRRRR
ncbi:SAV_2336 N-terminal domain-related protein [Streptomyces sp. NPDC006997]|uniref:SAV_2336 N-terminal domain-related protein n=1 Tax=Streptomyces sp. NPDC006997 TaxID=3155356 RepID=UPI0033F4526A